MVLWNSAAKTHTGKVRKVNEDSMVSIDDQGFWAVADGMGGHAAGDYASQTIVAAFEKMCFEQDLEFLPEYIDTQLTAINKHLKAYAQEQNATAVGSTVASIKIGQNNVGLAYWVGDSRIYQYREGVLRCLSRDHSLVQELVDLGELSAEEAKTSPAKNIITRAVGANDAIFSEICLFDYQKDDIYLLCTDGLINEVTDKEITKLLGKNRELDNMSQHLLNAALDETAADNITLILIKIV